jgi:hypothetical protein
MKLDSRVKEYPVLHLWLKFQTHTKQEVTRVFLPGVIYENVEMYGIQ